jgi:cytochrome bd-type quinol oxidase subunit 2
LWYCELALYLFVSIATWSLYGRASHPVHPSTYVFGSLAFVMLIAQRVWLQRSDTISFVSSSAFLLMLMGAAAATMYPNILPAYPPGSGGLSIAQAVPSPLALTTALVVTIGGGIVVFVYGAAVFRRMAGKIRVEEAVP